MTWPVWIRLRDGSLIAVKKTYEPDPKPVKKPKQKRNLKGGVKKA